MIPHLRCHRMIRPQTPPIAPWRADFRQSGPVEKVKKTARRFERLPRVLRLINVGAVIPPHRLYSARAPIHPKRPYSLTRPVVPPDGSFIFDTHFPRRPVSDAVPGGALTFCLRYLARLAWRLGHAATLVRSLRGQAVVLRICLIESRSRASHSGQVQCYPQNDDCHIQLIRLGCVCVRLSPTG